MERIFGAYDIRGLYPKEINESVVSKIADLLGRKVFRDGAIILGHDARKSSPLLYRSVGQALEAQNIKIMRAGLITTPMLSFLVNRFKASGGIMITASHNPKNYNGLKMVGRKAIPISGREIYQLIKNSY